MTKIKICGLFRTEDIDFVNEAKPDYIGFVFAKSHRQVSKETAQKLKSKLDKNILSVGVFVNEDINKAAEIANADIIDLVQLHGDEDDNYIKELKKLCNKKIIKAVKVKTGEDIIRWRNCQADWLMFDAGMGEGKTFDWNLLKSFIRPYFLAGGINENNLEQAMKLNPYCIDVSSGVETNKVKDKQKILNMTNIIRGVKYE
jgi:phosphoribosylanthranilate isomerase